MAPNLGGLFCPASVGCQGNQGITIFANNAFLPQNLRTQMAANNIASFTMGRVGHSSDLAADSVHAQQREDALGNARLQIEDRRRWLLQGLGDQRLLPVRQDRSRCRSGRRRAPRPHVSRAGCGHRSGDGQHRLQRLARAEQRVSRTANRSTSSGAAVPRRKRSTG